MSAAGYLRQFLDEPAPPIRWQKIDSSIGLSTYRFTSQTWKGNPWEHSFWRVEPKRLSAHNLSILYITGDEVRASDLPYVRALSEITGLRTNVVFHVPNQPLWDCREDDLIAHTFEQFLNTQDRTWPLLFPMVRAAEQALALAHELDQRDGLSPQRYLVTGASKRGWVTWLLGALDRTDIAGIAPQVFDNLNFQEQLRAQKWAYGDKLSPMLDDYTRRELQKMMDTPRGRELTEAVDPYTFVDKITVPKLIINGANDPFWLVDSLSRYWKQLRGPKASITVPNAGHELGNGEWALRGLRAFAASLIENKPLPQIEFAIRGEEFIVTTDSPATAIRIWAAHSDDLEFSHAEWRPLLRSTDRSSMSARLPQYAQHMAIFAEMEYLSHGERYSLTTVPEIVTTELD